MERGSLRGDRCRCSSLPGPIIHGSSSSSSSSANVMWATEANPNRGRL